MDEIDLQIAEMIRDGHEPAAIIMSPRQMTRHLKALGGLSFVDDLTTSGYSYAGLTIYRSREIGGPTVVSRDVLDVLLKCGRWAWGGSPLQEGLSTARAHADWRPLLF